jgi:hypothetical protein
MKSSRRTFLKTVTAASLGSTIPSSVNAEAAKLPEATADKLPPWRGFNLLNKFNGQNHPFEERDFEWIAELGFNFVRLPMDYRAWIEDGDWTRFREATLKEIDQAVDFGTRHGIHVCLNFHRAPGYTVAKPPGRIGRILPGATKALPIASSVSTCSMNRPMWDHEPTSAWSPA